MRSPSLRILALVALLAVDALPLAAWAEPPERLTTPELIERARRRGEVGAARADLLLAFAFGAPHRLPSRFESEEPWDGTLALLELQARLDATPRSGDRALASEVLASGTRCSERLSLPHTRTTPHFWVQYESGTIGGGLSIGDYTTSLEAAWGTIVDSFGWAAPPLKATPGGVRYHVAVANLENGLYGFVSPSGTYAGKVGDNPNTSWDDMNAFASCMVLNRSYAGFPSPPGASLDATTAHELTHSIQFGLGALHTGGTAIPQSVGTDDAVFIEGIATWMEDEVFDDANDNHNYLWPSFQRSMGANPSKGYSYWVIWRAMAERFGAGIAGGGEDVFQAFWESISEGDHWDVMTAIEAAFAGEGLALADAYHDAAIALAHARACATTPHCLEEGPSYVAEAGPLPRHAAIPVSGGSVASGVEDDLALRWIELPASGMYEVRVENTSLGGTLRASAICDEGSDLTVVPFPGTAGPAGSVTLSALDAIGCSSAVAVVTNEAISGPNPSSSTSRSFTVSTTPLLSLSVEGTGGGSVLRDSPACAPSCGRSFPPGADVTLTPVADEGSVFEGWQGDVPAGCLGSLDPCTLTLDTPRDVSAPFSDVAPPDPVTVNVEPQPFTTSRRMTVSWSSDGAHEFDVRERRGGPTSPLPEDPTLWKSSTGDRAGGLVAGEGETACVSALARDAVHETAWSDEACTSVPLNDRSLTRRGSWRSRTSSAAYLGTFSKTRRRGSKLLARDVHVRHLALIATTCRRCGTVKVLMDGALVEKVRLRSSRTQKGRVIRLRRFDGLREGTVKIVVVSRDRPVKIEGLGVSQV